MFRKFIVLFIGSFLSIGFQANGADVGLSPSSLKLAVYKVSVSTSPLCTNLMTVIDNGSTPSEVNFVGGVQLGTGTIPIGVYPCIAIEFSDNIKFTPAANSTSGNCLASTEETLDVCRSGNGDTSVLADGTVTTCTNGADRVAMYLSTASSQTTQADAFNPPTTLGDSTKGFNLGNALTVSGAASGKFIANPAGQVCDGNDSNCEGGGNPGTCNMGPPAFSFSQL